MVVLDTHIWLWWINQDPKLKPIWLNHIEQAAIVGISAISLFEVSWLEKHNRIVLSCPLVEWFEKALNGSGVELLPITPEIAAQTVNLPEHHRDPQDSIIIFTSLVHNALLLSADGKFQLYSELKNKLVS